MAVFLLYSFFKLCPYIHRVTFRLLRGSMSTAPSFWSHLRHTTHSIASAHSLWRLPQRNLQPPAFTSLGASTTTLNLKLPNQLFSFMLVSAMCCSVLSKSTWIRYKKHGFTCFFASFRSVMFSGLSMIVSSFSFFFVGSDGIPAFSRFSFSCIYWEQRLHSKFHHGHKA